MLSLSDPAVVVAWFVQTDKASIGVVHDVAGWRVGRQKARVPLGPWRSLNGRGVRLVYGNKPSVHYCPRIAGPFLTDLVEYKMDFPVGTKDATGLACASPSSQVDQPPSAKAPTG